MSAAEIPDTVLDGLEGVREGGLVNMLDRNGVIVLMEEFNEEAAAWLASHPDRYMKALHAMGGRRAQRPTPR